LSYQPQSQQLSWILAQMAANVPEAGREKVLKLQTYSLCCAPALDLQYVPDEEEMKHRGPTLLVSLSCCSRLRCIWRQQYSQAPFGSWSESLTSGSTRRRAGVGSVNACWRAPAAGYAGVRNTLCVDSKRLHRLTRPVGGWTTQRLKHKSGGRDFLPPLSTASSF
jgi:hypothetical protein